MEQTTQITVELISQASPSPGLSSEDSADEIVRWTKDTCPNCGYANADVDSDGVLWCPACGYSKKGCYT